MTKRHVPAPKTLVSIIIPVMGRFDLLERCLDAIPKACSSAYEIIVVDVALALLQRLSAGHSERALAALFFVAGLSLFNHVQMGILLAGAAACLAGHLLVARRAGAPVDRFRLLATAAASFLLGFAPYAVTFAFDVKRAGLGTALRQALGGDFQSVMARGTPGEALADVVFLVVLQFPSPFLLAVAAGTVLLWRRWRSSHALLGLVTAFAVNTALFAFYNRGTSSPSCCRRSPCSPSRAPSRWRRPSPGRPAAAPCRPGSHAT